MNKALTDLARQVYSDAGNADDAAVTTLAAQLAADVDLHAVIFAEMAKHLLGIAMREERTACVSAAPLMTKKGFVPRYTDEQQKRITLASKSILDWPLMDRKTRLRDATKEHLLADADRYAAMAEGTKGRCLMLRKIASQLQPGQTPTAAGLTDDGIRELIGQIAPEVAAESA